MSSSPEWGNRMSSSPSPFTQVSSLETRTPSEHMDRLETLPWVLSERLTHSYGECGTLRERRLGDIRKVLSRFQEAYGELPCAVYRAPSRISLNPHSDHQGAWVP